MDSDVAKQLESFFQSRGSVVLFAGAGVSAKAGLPTWGGLIKRLAETCRSRDLNLYHAIVGSVDRNRLLPAATQLFTADVPVGDLHQSLEEILKHYDAAQLQCLARLPFKYAVTTNYDRALHDAFAKENGSSPPDFFYPDSSLGRIPYDQDFFYVARLHGRVETPESPVLTEEHYRILSATASYEDALRDLFTKQNLLFVGFSFLDPAIETALAKVARSVSAIQKGRHLALVPDDAPALLLREFSNRNITVVPYKADEKHTVLWKALCEVANGFKKTKIKPPVQPTDPFATTKRYLASCYARFKLARHMNSLRDTVIEGIVSNEIISKSGRLTATDIAKTVSELLAIPSNESTKLAQKAIYSLVRLKLCEIGDTLIKWIGPADSKSQPELELLTQGVINRLAIQSPGSLKSVKPEYLAMLLENTIVQRGWDLGAAFASNQFPTQLKLATVVRRSSPPAEFPADAVIRAIESLLMNPETREAVALAQLGRISFALELVVRSPRDAAFHAATLPESVYLDANVLMPAIVDGHPYKSVYDAAISALIRAADHARIGVEVVANRVVLEEILSHRHRGIEQMMGGEAIDKAILRNEVLFYGSENLNVYRAGYAGILASDNDMDFKDYIGKYAPYSTQLLLQQFLEKKGITVAERPPDERYNLAYAHLLHELEKGYAQMQSIERKEARLIAHDALQLAKLQVDLENGRRAIFVTADRRLRDVVEHSRFSMLSNAMISHVGLANLIDLVVGIDDQSAGAAKLMWGTAITEQAEQVRNYLVNLALNQYDAALVKSMGNIVDDVTEDIVFEAERIGVKLEPRSEDEKTRVTKLLEQYEDRFFEKMRSTVEGKTKH